MFQPTIRIKTRLKPISAKIELTPLIDMLFLLLIFFMVSSSFFRISGISVDLPRADAPQVKDVGRCVVTIEQDGQIYFNESPVSMEKLKRTFQSMVNKDISTFIIRADTRVPYGTVISVLTLAAEYRIKPFLSTVSDKPQTKRTINPVTEE